MCANLRHVSMMRRIHALFPLLSSTIHVTAAGMNPIIIASAVNVLGSLTPSRLQISSAIAAATPDDSAGRVFISCTGLPANVDEGDDV